PCCAKAQRDGHKGAICGPRSGLIKNTPCQNRISLPLGHTQLLTQRYLIRFGTVKYILALASGKFPEKPYILPITLQHSMMYSSPRPATKSASRFLIGIFLTGKKLITFHFSCEYFTLIAPACFLLA